MDPAIYKEFLAAFIAETNTILAQQNAHIEAAKAELGRIKIRLKALVNALADGLPARSVRDEMLALEVREDELNAMLASQRPAKPAMHPQLANLYRERVAALHEALRDPATKDEAFGIIRTLIDEVRLVPTNGKLQIEIRGALAGILALSSNNPKASRLNSESSASVLFEQVKLVAGPGFEPGTFRL
jgi:site-specific DNA recombinase